jgi:hypothetical protein
MNKPIILINRIKEVYQLEGFFFLIKRIFSYLHENTYHHGKYFLYEHHIIERDEKEFAPKIQDYSFKIFEDTRELYALIQKGFSIKPHMANIIQWIELGAIAFCVFKDKELIHTGWIVMTHQAKARIEPFPYYVDFKNNEACTGGTWTKPTYRGKGLMRYGYFKRFEYLNRKGVSVSRNIVAVNNISSQRAHAKFNPHIYALAEYTKILFWKSWREIFLNSDK